MPWQSLIQIPSFFEPPLGAPPQDDAAEFHAAQQFGNVVAWSLAAVMALSFLVDPPLVAAEEPPPVEPSVIGSGHLVQVGKFESTLVIPSHGFDPPWPPTPDVVEEPPLSGANQVVLADPFYQTVLVPGSSFDPPWPPPSEVVDESPVIEASKQFIGLDPLVRLPQPDLGFEVDPPLDVGVEWLVGEVTEPDPLRAQIRTPGTLAEAPIEPNLPVAPVDDPLLALAATQVGNQPFITVDRRLGLLAEPPLEPTLPIPPVDDPLLALAAAQVGNLPFPVSPAQPRGTLAEPPPYETLPPPIPPEDASVVAGAQLVQVGKFYSVITAPKGSFDPPWDTSGGELPFDPSLLPPGQVAVPLTLPVPRVGLVAEPPWDTSAGVLPFDPALLPQVLVGLPTLRYLGPTGAFTLEPPSYPALPVIPVEPVGGEPSLGIEERFAAYLSIDEVTVTLIIEERLQGQLRSSVRED